MPTNTTIVIGNESDGVIVTFSDVQQDLSRVGPIQSSRPGSSLPPQRRGSLLGRLDLTFAEGVRPPESI